MHCRMVSVSLPLLSVFLGGSVGKEPACNGGDSGAILGSGRSPGEGNGKLLQYSCLENSMDRRVWWAAVHGVTKSQTQLSDQHFSLSHDNKAFTDFANCSWDEGEYWSALPRPPPGYIPNPGIEPTSLISPALAGMVFTTRATWETQTSGNNGPCLS